MYSPSFRGGPIILAKKESSCLLNTFRKTSEEVSALLKIHKCTLEPYKDFQLPHFSKLTTARQNKAILDLNNYLTSIKQALASEIDLRSDQQALWSALRYLNLTPKSDVFENIKKNDAIEIYDLNNIQIWRNLGFMDVCSYTIEEIFSYTWLQRYERDEIANAKAVKEMEKIISDDGYQTIYPNIKNILIEKFSAKRFIVDVLHKCASPLLDKNHQLAAFVVISKVDLIKGREHITRPEPFLEL